MKDTAVSIKTKEVREFLDREFLIFNQPPAHINTAEIAYCPSFSLYLHPTFHLQTFAEGRNN